MKLTVLACDRCDARLDRDKDLTTITVKHSDARRKNGKAPLDLCGECATAFEAWLAGAGSRRTEAQAVAAA